MDSLFSYGICRYDNDLGIGMGLAFSVICMEFGCEILNGGRIACFRFMSSEQIERRKPRKHPIETLSY